jgi:hypothetical protein
MKTHYLVTLCTARLSGRHSSQCQPPPLTYPKKRRWLTTRG